LNAVVKRLRDALGDSADTPRFLEPCRVAAIGSSPRDAYASCEEPALRLSCRIVYARSVPLGADLMMIENFR
jgi:hypothetical protein